MTVKIGEKGHAHTIPSFILVSVIGLVDLMTFDRCCLY